MGTPPSRLVRARRWAAGLRAPTSAARTGRRPGRGGARAGSRSTHVRLRSMMIRLGVIAGSGPARRARERRRRGRTSRSSERFRAEKLVDPGRAIRVQESVGPAGLKHRLGPVRDLRRAACGQPPGAAAICRSARAACIRERSTRRTRSRLRPAAGIASRPTSSSPRDRPCRAAADPASITL